MPPHDSTPCERVPPVEVFCLCILTHTRRPTQTCTHGHETVRVFRLSSEIDLSGHRLRRISDVIKEENFPFVLRMNLSQNKITSVASLGTLPLLRVKPNVSIP